MIAKTKAMTGKKAGRRRRRAKGLYVAVLCFGFLFVSRTSGTALAEEEIPQRIISLGPSLTEIIYLLGAEERLIANTVYCNSPPAARQKTKIGTVVQASTERILSLRPDLVLAIPLSRKNQLKSIEDLGIRVARFKTPQGFDAICNQVLELGRIVGREEKARLVVYTMREEVKAIRERTRDLTRKRVFVQIGARPLYTVTRDSFVNDFIRFAGGINIAFHESSGIYSREKVLLGDPEVIIIASMGIAGEKEKAIWTRYPSISAVKANNIHVVEADTICSPTPVTFVDVLREITEIIHPGLLKE
ncbi:MAG: ABC transporter substrate-binding protein [Deltaproteobacteria bacterium]|nr:ABC transporter substrate-binding protein [Deltaproteobacteria bacterium]